MFCVGTSVLIVLFYVLGRLCPSIKERQKIFHLCSELLLRGALRVRPPRVHLPAARPHVHGAVQQEGGQARGPGGQAASGQLGNQRPYFRLSGNEREIICSNYQKPLFNKSKYGELISLIYWLLCTGKVFSGS